LRSTTEDRVAQFLQRIYPAQEGPPWVCDIAGEPYLYIDFYRDGPIEMEPENWASLVNALGGDPVVSVVADVSGRNPGDVQVRSFIEAMLGQFEGLAQDDYTCHCWTAEEVRSGCTVHGHAFFDYRGWFEEKEKR
jgi:hypothetical protein